ncbi:hypothetical protein NQ318_020901 [Aromia moschata]|uniref:C2H2-type domain-containing protein n=1 Tax=Aromia moschata TaxID=1265417 RepID=A0AAV8XY27_9CUCU|nr:hypothetical protein NQ318_020901 [Aromia moschata]
MTNKYDLREKIRCAQKLTKSITLKALHASDSKPTNIIRNKKPQCCHLCGKTFKDTRRLKRHLTSHSEERPFPCMLCGKTFKRKQEVSAHSAHVHDSSMSFECDFCSKKLKSRASWMTHRKRHLKDYIVKCELCSRGFVTKQEYNNHMGSSHGKSSNICTVCGRSCYDKATLQSHMARHSENYLSSANIKCKLCDKTFLQDKYLKRHFRRIHKNGGQQLKKRKLRRIKKEVDPDYVAPKAKQTEKQNESIVIPKEETSTDENSIKFACELCEEKIDSSIDFALHSVKHSSDNKYHCHYCTFKSVLIKRMKKHMKSHGNTGKSFQCQTCSKIFPECIQAIEHKNFHSGEMPYKCETCEKHFMFSWLLFTHRRLFHWDVKIDPIALTCDTCNMSFGTRSGLRKHFFDQQAGGALTTAYEC